MSTAVYLKTAGDIYREALRAATITGSEMTAEASDLALAATATNDVLKLWQTKQIHLWSETEALLPLNPNQQKYTLGIGGDHCFTDYVYTTGVAALAGVTAIDVGSTEGMNSGDNIGIELSNNVRQWTTINTIIDANSLTLSEPLSASINDGSSIYVYTTGIDQPIRILNARYSDDRRFDDLPIKIISRQEYYDQPTKDTTGSVTNIYYSRQLGVGHLSVWPVATRANNFLRFTFIKPQYIPEDQSENILIPDEFYLALKWAVAAELGTIYVIDANRQVILEAKAAAMLEEALSTDVEFVGFNVEPGCY